MNNLDLLDINYLKTIDAQQLRRELCAPNVMVNLPFSEESIPAISYLLENEIIDVNEHFYFQKDGDLNRYAYSLLTLIVKRCMPKLLKQFIELCEELDIPLNLDNGSYDQNCGLSALHIAIIYCNPIARSKQVQILLENDANPLLADWKSRSTRDLVLEYAADDSELIQLVDKHITAWRGRVISGVFNKEQVAISEENIAPEATLELKG